MDESLYSPLGLPTCQVQACSGRSRDLVANNRSGPSQPVRRGCGTLNDIVVLA